MKESLVCDRNHVWYVDVIEGNHKSQWASAVWRIQKSKRRINRKSVSLHWNCLVKRFWNRATAKKWHHTYKSNQSLSSVIEIESKTCWMSMMLFSFLFSRSLGSIAVAVGIAIAALRAAAATQLLWLLFADSSSLCNAAEKKNMVWILVGWRV